MTDNLYLPILELTRGKVVESIHYGAVAVSDNQGRLVAWYGDPEAVTYLRSSAKPFQALPFLEHDGMEHCGLTSREVALICASHSGTDEHVKVVRSIQEKCQVHEDQLMCGTHPVSHPPTIEAMRLRGEEPTPNRHNCSGKHSGMLAYARLKREAFPDKSSGDDGLVYIDPAHPIQKDILQVFAEMCDVPVEQVNTGIDGCSAPNFAVPLRNAAMAFARLCDPGQLPAKRAEACRHAATSMMAHPDMVGGPDSFDTHLMQATAGRIVCKGGAEGYQALGLVPGALGPGSPALGITLKISDGDLVTRGKPRGNPKGTVRPAVTLEVLRQLGALSENELEALSGFGPTFGITNWRGITVGEARPIFALRYPA